MPDFLLLVYKKRIGSALSLAKNEMIDKYSSASAPALYFWLIKMKGNIRLYALLISDQVRFGAQKSFSLQKSIVFFFWILKFILLNRVYFILELFSSCMYSVHAVGCEK